MTEVEEGATPKMSCKGQPMRVVANWRLGMRNLRRRTMTGNLWNGTCMSILGCGGRSKRLDGASISVVVLSMASPLSHFSIHVRMPAFALHARAVVRLWRRAPTRVL